MLTVQTSCKKQYTCKVFVLLFHDIKIVKLSNCGKHHFLRIFVGESHKFDAQSFVMFPLLIAGRGVKNLVEAAAGNVAVEYWSEMGAVSQHI